MAGTVNGELMSPATESDIVDDPSQFPQKLCNFMTMCLRNSLVSMTTMLHLVHKRYTVYVTVGVQYILQ